MKLLLLTPIFKRFKKSTFFSSLNQNSCPVYDAEEKKNKNNKKLLKSCTHKNKTLASCYFIWQFAFKYFLMKENEKQKCLENSLFNGKSF